MLSSRLRRQERQVARLRAYDGARASLLAVASVYAFTHDESAACYASRYPELRARFCATDRCDTHALHDHYKNTGATEGRRWGCGASSRNTTQKPPSSRRDKLRTCAVVYSSGVLLKEERGKDIDAHDAVFRINVPPTHPYEAHVGRKTTYNVVHFARNPSPGERFARMQSNQTGITFEFGHKESAGFKKWKTNHTNWILVPRRFINRCNQIMGLMKGKYCSSGAATVLWAMEQCDRVTVFGMQHDRCYQYHYWDPKPSRCAVKGGVNAFLPSVGGSMHDMDKEHTTIQQWIDDPRKNVWAPEREK